MAGRENSRIPSDSPTIALHVGEDRDGDPVWEELPVTPLGNERYRLLASPTLLAGIAAGDEITLDPDGRHSLLKRGENVVVYLEMREKYDLTAVLAEVNAIGGVLDGRADSPPDAFIATFTVPVQATFPAIEDIFSRFVADKASADWHYGNVYDAGGNPLNWWLA
jgi:hypothetical protein